MQLVSEAEKWPRNIRRASLNSFGYGGANAHAILESIDSFMGRGPYEDARDNQYVKQDLLVLPISAASSNSLDLRIKQILGTAQCCNAGTLHDLALTLSLRMPHMSIRSYLVARADATGSIEGEGAESTSYDIIESRHNSLPFAFVFTGQGAQYAGMASELLRQSPTFLKSIRKQDEVLKSLPPPYTPHWTLEQALDDPPEISQVHRPSRSQPLCTAIQIALVQVLRSWGITSSAVIGHSSGEIAAAYAASLLR